MSAPKKRRAKAKAGRILQTFSSAGAAAKEFYAGNEDFFDNVRDPKDGVRDFLDGMDGARGKRMTETAKGRSILAKRSGRGQIIDVLTYVFGMSGSRRWDRVEWSEVQRLEDSLLPFYEPYGSESQVGGLTWKPLAVATADDVGSMSQSESALFYAHQSRELLGESISRIKSAFEKNKKCLTVAQRKHVRRRIAEWSAWRDDARKIPSYACDPDPQTGGMTCDYPLIDGELRELSQACKSKYDANWSSKKRGRPGFQDELQGEEQEFAPIEDFQEEAPEPCTINDAAAVMGRHSARKRKRSRHQLVMGRVVKT